MHVRRPAALGFPRSVVGDSVPAPRGLLLGPPRPQTPGYIRSQPLRDLAPGAPRPGPGSLFPRRKSDQNAAGDTPDPALSQSVGIRLDAALPLNQRFLRASDLRRVSCPTSPDGLLKGQANLGFYDELPAAMGSTLASPPPPKRNTPQPEGRQAQSDMHRTDYEGQLEIRWQPRHLP